MATQFNIYRVNTLPSAGVNGDIYFLKKGTRYESYVVQPNGELIQSKGMSDAELAQLNNTYSKAYIDDKFEDVNLGVSGSITTTQTLPQLNALPDGIYEAQTNGTYANGLTAKDGYYTKFKKVGTVWTLNSEVKMPSVDTANLVTKSSIKSSSVNLFDKSTMVLLNTLINSEGALQSPVTGWHTAKIDVSQYDIGQAITFFGITGNTGLYWAFYNGSTLITPWSAVANSFNPRLKKTVFKPENATWLYIDIKAPADVDSSVYSQFMVNLGETPLPFQPYEGFISEIDGKKIKASGGESYDQSLNTTDSVTFDSVTANEVEINGTIKSGTLASPPVGLVSGEFWLDTTDSTIHPIIRRMA